MLRSTLVAISLACTLWGCGNRSKTPDVSGVPVTLQTIRFEQEFFGLDTNNLDASVESLRSRYPMFTVDFVERILGIPWGDSSPMKYRALNQFLSDYRPIKAEAEKAVGDFGKYEKEIKKGLQYVKHYFPAYKTPGKIITFVGPLDAYAEGKTGGYGDIITPEALAVGLQLHLGSQSEIYLSPQGQQLYPAYVSRRFDPAYITVNCMKNVVDDLYPGMGADRSLLDLMVDKGKRLYLLDRFLPETPDSLKIGYTDGQLKGSGKNEGLIWNFFLQNNLLFETDLQKIKSFVGDGPKTPELGDDSPGYISLYMGRQIIRTYMEKFPDTPLDKLLQLDAKTILNESKYKPK
jgi:hypothetical protein